jgi:hypothetical protein
MDSILQRGTEQFMAALRERSQKQHGILNIRHGIGT